MMAKNPQQKLKRKPPRQDAKSEALPAKESFLENNFAYWIAGLFLLLSYIGIINHEPWRDEYQAWLIARDAHSFFELLRNLKYEGHPALWHSLLWILTKFTRNPFVMQVFHIGLSTAAVFLLNRYAPFSLLDKVLFTFGYYSFYEFNLISRSYGLGFLLVVVFLVLYKNRRKYYLPLSVILFLLANTHVYGLILSLCFSGILALDYIQKTRAGEFEKLSLARLAICILIIGAGVVVSALQIYPEPDNSYPIPYPDKFDWPRMEFAIWRVMTAYFPLPRFWELHFWNTNLLESIKKLPNGAQLPDVSKMYVIVPAIVFLVFELYFLRKPLALLFYTMGTILLVCFYYYSLLVFSRYTSHLTVVLVASMWLAGYYPDVNWKNRLLIKLSSMGKFAGKYLFTVILAVGFAAGIISYANDLRHEFSASQAMADFLKSNDLDKLPIVGVPDFVISPAAAILDTKIFYPQRNEYGSFIIWDKKRRDRVEYSEIVQRMQEMDQQGVKRMLLITDSELSSVDPATLDKKPIEVGMITDELHIQLLKRVPAGIVADEKYFIYLVEHNPLP